jgi:hypothetical protein
VTLAAVKPEMAWLARLLANSNGFPFGNQDNKLLLKCGSVKPTVFALSGGIA